MLTSTNHSPKQVKIFVIELNTRLLPNATIGGKKYRFRSFAGWKMYLALHISQREIVTKKVEDSNILLSKD